MSMEGRMSLTGHIRRQLERTRRSYPETSYGWAFVSRGVRDGESECIGIHTMGGEQMPLTLEMLRRLDEGRLDDSSALSLAGLILLGGVHPVLLRPVPESGRRESDGQVPVRRVGFCVGLTSPVEGWSERVAFEGRVTASDLVIPLLAFSSNRPPGWPR